MKTIIIDDDKVAVDVFRQYTKDVECIEIIGAFSDGAGALSFARKHRVDLVVLDVKIKGMDGIELGKILRAVFPEILLMYTTCYEEYAIEAVKLHAAAYLLKPYTKEELQYDIQTAKLLSKRGKDRIFIRTFGYFDVFVDNKPIMFRSGKAKELLALLVDRQGGTVNTEQIICALWEDRPNDEATQNLCSKTTKALKNELQEYGIEDLLIINRSMKRVDTEYFTCDLYELLEEDEKAKKRFVGDYMLEYSWAEERMAGLSKYLS